LRAALLGWITPFPAALSSAETALRSMVSACAASERATKLSTCFAYVFRDDFTDVLRRCRCASCRMRFIADLCRLAIVSLPYRLPAMWWLALQCEWAYNRAAGWPHLAQQSRGNILEPASGRQELDGTKAAMGHRNHRQKCTGAEPGVESAFYALHDAQTPVRIGICAMLLDIILDVP
jgi:hypothetical protein